MFAQSRPEFSIFYPLGLLLIFFYHFVLLLFYLFCRFFEMVIGCDEKIEMKTCVEFWVWPGDGFSPIPVSKKSLFKVNSNFSF